MKRAEDRRWSRFDGGTISSDGGAFLLRQTDRRLNLLPRLAECFLDGRNQEQVEHSILEMLSQRIYGLALGYEDLNDHEQLRNDPVSEFWRDGRTWMRRWLEKAR
jgi:hypothetical protein